MLAQSAGDVRARAEPLAAALAAAVPGVQVEILAGSSAVGGGAAPTTEVPTTLLTLVHPTRSAARLAARLRTGTPPVVVRVADDRVVLDLRTVRPDEDSVLAAALRQALG